MCGAVWAKLPRSGWTKALGAPASRRRVFSLKTTQKAGETLALQCVLKERRGYKETSAGTCRHAIR